MKLFKHTYNLLFFLLFGGLIVGCSRYTSVPKNQYLLIKNKLNIKGDKVYYSDFKSIIRQVPNQKILGLPFSLLVHNSIDSSTVQKKHLKLLERVKRSNARKIKKNNIVNEKRIEKSQKRGESFYEKKDLFLEDTTNIRLSFMEWMKFKLGEPPVIFDSIYYNKTLDQFKVFLHSKGYYDASIVSKIEYKKKKAKVYYQIHTGQPFVVSGFKVTSSNDTLIGIYKKFKEDLHSNIELNKTKFDSKLLDDYREKVAYFFREQGLYGFSNSNVKFLVDSSNISKSVSVEMQLLDRTISVNSGLKEIVPFSLKKINAVYFHVIDTSYVLDGFKNKVYRSNLTLFSNGFVRTLDTLRYKRNSSSSLIHVTYNSYLPFKPDVFDQQNFVFVDSNYTQSFVDKTNFNLANLGLFQLVKPEIIEDYATSKIEVHFYLVLKKTHSFPLSLRFTRSDVFFGFSGSANYTNINLFKGAERFTLSLTGGFQSMPTLAYSSTDQNLNSTNNAANQVFNTFEIGPSMKLELPGIYPFSFLFKSKSIKKQTILATNLGFQHRNVFTRESFKLSFLYSLSFSDKNELQIGFPGVTSINFSNFLNFDETFKKNIYNFKDPFTQNYYTNLMNWQDLKLIYSHKSTSNNKVFNYKSNLDISGNVLNIFRSYQIKNNQNQYMILGVPYSQFVKLDNEFIQGVPFSRFNSLNYKLGIGIGIPYGNSKLALPFDYSFFGGGPNDNRGWRAGSLGPGSYNYYLDKNYSTVQLGDIRLAFSTEYRFKLTKYLRGAVFMDAGNIWTYNLDEKRPGSQFSKSWMNEISVASGLGLRADFEYFILRMDIGFKLRNPALTSGKRWFFDPTDQEVQKVIDENPAKFSSPFFPKNWNDIINSIRVGIGYPF